MFTIYVVGVPGDYSKSTRFSHEFLFGRKMGMSLDELVEQWTGKEKEKDLYEVGLLRLARNSENE